MLGICWMMVEVILPMMDKGLLWWLSGKESACQCRRHRDTGSIPVSKRYPGEGNGNPLQYSYLGNPTEREAWWATVHGVAKELDMT